MSCSCLHSSNASITTIRAEVREQACCISKSGCKIIVAVTTAEGQQEKVIGAAIWQCQGDDLGAQKIIAEWTDPGKFPALLSTHNRALDPSKKTILVESAPYTKHYWAGSCATN